MIRVSAIALLALLARPLAAQQMRRSPDGERQNAEPARLVLPTIASDPARFFVGVWQGTFHGPFNDDAGMTVAIEFVNGGYAGYSAMAMEPRLHAHATDSLMGDSLVWTQPNMNNNGTLYFVAKRTGANTLRGYMQLRGAANPPQGMRQPTFELRRVRQ